MAMAWLINGEIERLQGPLGQEFLAAVRDQFPERLGDASTAEMARFFSEQEPEQLAGSIGIEGRDSAPAWNAAIVGKTHRFFFFRLCHLSASAKI